MTGLLSEFGIVVNLSVSFHAGNTGVVQIVTNPVFHERSKHIEVDCHFIREKYQSSLVSLLHVSSKDQLAPGKHFDKNITLCMT